MATPALAPTPAVTTRAAINRTNAQRSTGPRTAAGKDRVRLNALKHGALSRTVVFPYEDQAAFDALGAKLTADYRPATPEQRELLTAIQNTHWRLDRVLSLEAHLEAVGIRGELTPARNTFPNLDANGHIEIARAWNFRDHARQFEQLNRQETRLRRLLHQQVADYIELQAVQTPPEPEPAPEPAPSSEVPATAHGFVSQKQPTPRPKPDPRATAMRKPPHNSLKSDPRF